MARIGQAVDHISRRRNAAPVHTCSRHSTSLRSGEELCRETRIAKRRRCGSTTGESVERGRKGDAWIESKIVRRRKDREGSVSSSRFLSPRRCAGFPRGTFAMDRHRCCTCERDRKSGRAIAEISGLRIGRLCSSRRGCERNICIRGLKAFSVPEGKKEIRFFSATLSPLVELYVKGNGFSLPYRVENHANDVVQIHMPHLHHCIMIEKKMSKSC